MKHVRIYENFIKESTALTKVDKDDKLKKIFKNSPKLVSAEKILPCGAIVKVNDYTGIKTTESDFIRFDGGCFQITKEADGKISIYFSLDCSTAYNVSSGEIFYVKFIDGSVLKFPTSGDVANYSAGRFFHSALAEPSPTQLSIFKSKKINGLKYDIQETDIQEETADVFQNTLKCVISGVLPTTKQPAAQSALKEELPFSSEFIKYELVSTLDRSDIKKLNPSPVGFGKIVAEVRVECDGTYKIVKWKEGTTWSGEGDEMQKIFKDFLDRSKFEKKGDDCGERGIVTLEVEKNPNRF